MPVVILGLLIIAQAAGAVFALARAIGYLEIGSAEALSLGITLLAVAAILFVGAILTGAVTAVISELRDRRSAP